MPMNEQERVRRAIELERMSFQRAAQEIGVGSVSSTPDSQISITPPTAAWLISLNNLDFGAPLTNGPPKRPQPPGKSARIPPLMPGDLAPHRAELRFRRGIRPDKPGHRTPVPLDEDFFSFFQKIEKF